MTKPKRKINNYTVRVNVASSNDTQKRMIRYMIITLCALALFYTLMLLNMVWNITERKTLEANARNLSSEVGSLELTYLQLADKVDVAMSQSMGFQEVKPTFATPSKSLGSLAKLSKNEI